MGKLKKLYSDDSKQTSESLNALKVYSFKMLNQAKYFVLMTLMTKNLEDMMSSMS
jgi:hypothetical protein